MQGSILAAIARIETVPGSEINTKGLNMSTAREELEKAEKAYNEWQVGIIDYTAHENAFDAIMGLATATKESAYHDGLKAGMKMVFEAFT